MNQPHIQTLPNYCLFKCVCLVLVDYIINTAVTKKIGLLEGRHHFEIGFGINLFLA